jgi:EmrB/QacA subfamily drug resistance transporter
MKQDTRDRRWVILLVLCVTVFLVVVDNTIVNVALPTLSERLKATDSDLQWIVDGYSLPFAGLLLAGGGFSDRYGRRRVMQTAILAFGVFSLLAARSTNISELLVARALMGAAAAFIFPATLSLLTTTFDDTAERAKAFGFWGATSGVAVAFGPIVGGALITHYWFGSIFLVNIPIVVVAFVAVALVVPESRAPRPKRFDWPALLVGSAAITLLVFAIIEGPTWGWGTGSTLGLLALSALFFFVSVICELRREEPLLDVRVFTNRGFTAGAASIATSFFCLFGFIFLVTQYFQLIRGYSAFSAGVHTLPFAFVTMIATPLGAVLALRIGTRYVVSVGLLVMGAALVWMATISASAQYLGPVIDSMIVLALGFSLITAPSTAAIMKSLPPAQIGAGAAVNETTREIGGTLGVAVVGSVFSSLFTPQVRMALFHLRLSRLQLDAAQGSMQSALGVLRQVPRSSPAFSDVSREVTSAFMNGFHRGCLVAAFASILMGIAVFQFLPKEAARKEELVLA